MRNQLAKWQVIKNKYTKTMLLLLLYIMIYVVLLSVYVYFKIKSNPSEINGIKEYLNAKVVTNYSSIDFLNIIIMNVISTGSIILFAIIPVPYLYALPAIGTISTMGQVVGYVVYDKGLVVGLKLAITGILPHGILEITSYIIVLILAKKTNDISINILKRIWKRQHLNYKFIGSLLYTLLKSFVVYTLPLLIIAAIIESFITPIIMNVFM
ncbi:stage II sporulation protein M [Leuconostoc inhae]|uniref:stage II sporulation protein M n=1 Tax=Leuconostoc inhae TaxID=178001 RepID=UPI001FE8FEA6|nr:stage II sporulation protein M [Leuconostoc inhae]